MSLDAIFFDVDDTLFSTSEFAHKARLASCEAMAHVGLKLEVEQLMAEQPSSVGFALPVADPKDGLRVGRRRADVRWRCEHVERRQGQYERQREAEILKRTVCFVSGPDGGEAQPCTVAEMMAKLRKMNTADGPGPAPAPKRAGIDYSKWDNLEDSD